MGWIKRNLAYIQVASGATIVSFGAILVRLTDTPPVTDAFYRMLIAAIVLSAAAIWRRDSWRLDKIALRWCLLAGFVFTLDLCLWHMAIDRIGPGLATVLLNIQVFFLAFAGLVFYKESLNRWLILALCLITIALYLMLSQHWVTNGSGFKVGVACAIAAALCYASYILCLRQGQQRLSSLSPFVQLALICWTSVIVISVSQVTHIETLTLPNLKDTSLLVAYSISAQVVGWLLIAIGIKRAKISIAAFLLLLQPAFSFLWDVILLGRQTTLIDATGTLIALIAIYFATKKP